MIFQICVYRYSWLCVANAVDESTAKVICDALASSTGSDFCVMDSDDEILYQSKRKNFLK